MLPYKLKTTSELLTNWLRVTARPTCPRGQQAVTELVWCAVPAVRGRAGLAAARRAPQPPQPGAATRFGLCRGLNQRFTCLRHCIISFHIVYTLKFYFTSWVWMCSAQSLCLKPKKIKITSTLGLG